MSANLLRIISVTVDKTAVPKRTEASSGSRITKKVWIKASTDVVYQALTESKALASWFCDRASCDPREGGELVAFWKTGKSSQKGCALFTHLAPSTRLELLWIDDGNGPKEKDSSHTLSYEIRSKSGMTELVMTDKDDSVSDEETSSFLDRGWNSVLLELKDYCERKERTIKIQPRSKSSRHKSPQE
jgi:uncharacterized protein YndB with AHSA1/START domain